MPDTTERIRLTISVTPEVHSIFTQMSEASGMSLGRAMGDWLADTSEAAQFIALKMVEAKEKPRQLIREAQAMLHGAQLELQALKIRQGEGLGGTAAGVRVPAAQQQPGGRVKPPSSLTGVNSTGRKARKP